MLQWRRRVRSSTIAFQFTSTNLMLELGVILWLLMEWQFTRRYRGPAHPQEP